MSLFICHATGGRCEDWDPDKGANAVLLQRTKDNNLYDGPPTVRVYRRVQLSLGDAIDEAALMKEAEAQNTVAESLEQIRVDKLGGGAVWLSGSNPPMNQSGKPMRLLAQLTTSLVHFDITPKGMAYIFIDQEDTSEASGRLMWQGG